MINYCCHVCIEDEFHVFFKCPRFNQERQMFIFSWYNGEHNFLNFCNLMQISDESKLKSIAFFITEIMKKKDVEQN